MAGLSFAAWFGEWMPFPVHRCKRSVVPLPNRGAVQTDNEAKLLIASRPCFSNALVSVRDSLLDVESM